MISIFIIKFGFFHYKLYIEVKDIGVVGINGSYKLKDMVNIKDYCQRMMFFMNKIILQIKYILWQWILGNDKKFVFLPESKIISTNISLNFHIFNF